MHKHFIDLDKLTRLDLCNILDLAKEIKNQPMKFCNNLEHKSLGMLFEKQSTRTKVSFDIGMKNMGGNVIELNSKSIGFGSRESDSDIIKVLSQYLNCLVIRNNDHDKIKSLAEFDFVPIINGLSNYSHPCQILSDVFTIEENMGPISNLLIVWCGDINNVLVSLMQASIIFNFNLHIASPKIIMHRKQDILNKYVSNKIKFFDNPYDAVVEADCVMTDVWISMGANSSHKDKSVFEDFQINDRLMSKTKNKSLFMHCLPAHRNEEVTDSVIDGEKSIIWQQAKNRMVVQQSILNFCIA